MSSDSTGTRAILTASILVAVELLQATDRMLQGIGSPERPWRVLGLPGHLYADILKGHMKVTMEDVTHWLTNLVHHEDKYPSLRPYLSSGAAGRVVLNLELLLRH